MIQNNDEYLTTKQSLEDMESALIALKNKLTNNPELFQVLSESYIDQIKKFRIEINTYTGITSAEEMAIPLWLGLKGEHIGVGNVRMSLLSGFLGNFKLAVQRIAEYSTFEFIRTAGRPKEELRKLSDFKIQFLPGSLRIGVSFPVPGEQTRLFGENIENPVEDSIKKILTGISWITGENTEDVETLFPNVEERFLVFSQIDNISPRINGEISSVEFKGKFVPYDSLCLSMHSIPKIKSAIERSIPPEWTSHNGIIREIDLDKNQFILRDIEGDIKELLCKFEELNETYAVKALNKKVTVTGKLHRNKYMKPKYLEAQSIKKDNTD